MKCPRNNINTSIFKVAKETDEWRADNTCSFCGSCNPDKLLEAMEAGTVVLGPTDKSYKVYVDGLERPHSKFYFQHFDDAQKKRFIDLLNEGKVKFGHPGHFYVLPFFIEMKANN